jgi:hypothetical protein
MLHFRRNHGTETVESTGKRHRVRSVVKAALAATSGWLLVKVVRKARQASDPSTISTEPDAEAGAGTDDGPAERHTSRAEPASASDIKANTSSA